MKNVAFILNPAARRGKNRAYVARLRAYLEKEMPRAKLFVTAGPGHAVGLAREAAEQGCRRIFSVGGDGTLNEVVNGVMALPAKQRPAVGTLASGTGGDFARRLKELYPFPKDFSWLLNPREHRIDVGRVLGVEATGEAGRHFVNIADAGIAGEVVRRVGLSRKLLGSLEYLRSSVLAALKYKAPRVRISLTLEDGGLWEAELNLLIALAANSRYFGGGMCIAPKAEFDDGRLFFMVAEQIPYLTLLRHLPRAYLNQQMRHPKIHYRIGTRMTVESLSGPMLLDIDGEFFTGTRISVEILPQALNLLIPSA